MKDEEFYERVEYLLDAERDNPLAWWYLSYAGEEGFRGGVIIEARGFTGAAIRSNILKASPGGEVMGLKIPPDKVPAEPYRNRLLSPSELNEIWGDMETLAELEGRPNERPEG
jgi:hypothetical protein